MSIGGFDGLRSGPMLLLFGRPPTVPTAPEQPSAIWHFGWGEVGVGETYLRHAAREVAWEPPLPAAKLHIHLQSSDPAQTAAWYRDVLGAQINVLPGAAARKNLAPRPELRVAEAAVWFGDFVMVIHRTDEPLVSTRGQRVDHIAFCCEDLQPLLSQLLEKGVAVLDPISPFGNARHVVIDGPDRIVIELLDSSDKPH